LIVHLNITKRDYQTRIDNIDKELTQTEELLSLNLEKLKVEELNKENIESIIIDKQHRLSINKECLKNSKDINKIH